MYVTAIGFPTHEHDPVTVHTHDLEGVTGSTIIGGHAEKAPGTPLVSDFTVAGGDYSKAGYSSVVLGAFADGGYVSTDSENPYNGLWNVVIGSEDQLDFDLGFFTAVVRVDEDSFFPSETVVIGSSARVLGSSFTDVGIGYDLRIGGHLNDPATGGGPMSGGGNVFVGAHTNSSGNEQWSIDVPDSEVKDSVVIGWGNEIYPPHSDPTNPIGYNIATDLSEDADSIVAIGTRLSTWGTGIIYISNSDTFTGSAHGRRLINIGGTNFVWRPEQTSLVPPIVVEYHDLTEASAVGNNLYPQGDESFCIGYGVGTSRNQHMVIGVYDHGAIWLYGNVELEVLDSLSDPIHSSAHGCVVWNVNASTAYTSGGDHSVVLDEILTMHQGDIYGGPRGPNLYENGQSIGTWFRIKKVDSSANTVTITASAGQTIDSFASIVLTDQYDYIDVVANEIFDHYTTPPFGGPAVFRREWSLFGGIVGGVPFGGGGAFTSTIIVQEADSTVDAAVTTLDFGSGFDITSAPAGEANIVLDLSEVAGGGDLSWATNLPTIPNDTVTYAKMQNVSAASRLLGRGSAGGSGDVEEITLGTNLSMSGTTLNATGGGGGVTFVTSDPAGAPSAGQEVQYNTTNNMLWVWNSVDTTWRATELTT